jgi:hypothetical protein
LPATSPDTKVTACRNCHARKDEKPALWPGLPQIKSENSTAVITLTNQQAFTAPAPGLIRNHVSFAGAAIAAAGFVSIVLMMLLEFTSNEGRHNPYVGIFTTSSSLR